MDTQATPSAQIVGQEFVKQYFTMLNAAPGHLHRFYSHNSSFIHGSADGRGEEQQAVTGQVEIHKKIMSLNFVNCHARIRQVDCQASVGGSVVVQVIGELSNNGQPMRRFVQTFVLAPQSAKKYYVHSDIFRYQDIYPPPSDGVCEDEAAEEDHEAGNIRCEYVQEEELAGEETVQQQQEQEPAADSGCDVSEHTVTPTYNSSVSANDGVAEESKLEDVSQDSVEEIQTETAKDDKDEGELEPEPEPEKVVEPAPVEEPVVPPKPLTWAAMASRNAGVQPAPASGSALVRPQPVVTEPKTEPNVAPNGPQKPTRPQALAEERNSTGRPVVNGGKDENGPRRAAGSGTGPVYPDNQQVFVGNLPQHLTDQDLIEFFEQYGKVLDFRINRKSGMSGNNVGQKNFGFMAFDSPETVQKVLTSRPIYMKKHRLNIEEKKPKEELAAARLSAPRYPNNSAYFVRSSDAPRRADSSRTAAAAATDNRSNSSDEGRTY